MGAVTQQRVPKPTKVAHRHVVKAAQERALELVEMVREESPDAVWSRLQTIKPDVLFATVILIAAMVPADKTVAELWAWADTLVVE